MRDSSLRLLFCKLLKQSMINPFLDKIRTHSMMIKLTKNDIRTRSQSETPSFYTTTAIRARINEEIEMDLRQQRTKRFFEVLQEFLQAEKFIIWARCFNVRTNFLLSARKIKIDAKFIKRTGKTESH